MSDCAAPRASEADLSMRAISHLTPALHSICPDARIISSRMDIGANGEMVMAQLEFAFPGGEYSALLTHQPHAHHFTTVYVDPRDARTWAHYRFLAALPLNQLWRA